MGLDSAVAAKAVSVIGLGKLGAPIAAVYADKGYTVVGVDVNAHFVAQINAGQAPVYEPGLQELLNTNRQRIVATSDAVDAVRRTDMTMIVVPTPSEPEGGFSLKFTLEACARIGEAIREKPWHLVVLTSTVMPGSTDGPVREALEAASGKRCGVDFGLCYSPEFIALGSVIHDLLFPDFLLIGESDLRSGEALAAFYDSITETHPPVARMNNTNAELAKLSVNTFVTTKIAFANMLARLCERLPDADADVVTSAIGLDSRIGRKYLKGAIAYGGPCFPRDNQALSFLARQLEVPALVPEATDNANRAETALLAERVIQSLGESGRAGVLGLAYKPNSDVVIESPGLLLAQALADRGVAVSVYDPAAQAPARAKLRGEFHYCDSAEACIADSDVVVIATPWEEFKHIAPTVWSRPGRMRTVIDCWRILDVGALSPIVQYVRLGQGPARTNGRD